MDLVGDKHVMGAARGAYGLCVQGIDDGGALHVRDAASWPQLHVETGLRSESHSRRAFVTHREASISTPVAHLTLDRAMRRLIVRSRVKLPHADLVHPCLWPAAAVFSRWLGAETLHGGAFADSSGGAWAVLGAQGAGKSSLMAALALAGHQVLADDLVVVDGRECFAGPRCIDLRPETVDALGLARKTSPVRSTHRWRLALGPSDGRFPLRGFVHLAWGSGFKIQPLTPGEHLGLLVGHRRVAALGADHGHLLDLAGLPAFRLIRPRARDALTDTCGRLLAAISHYTCSDRSKSPAFSSPAVPAVM
jgi:hypothetical protein